MNTILIMILFFMFGYYTAVQKHGRDLKKLLKIEDIKLKRNKDKIYKAKAFFLIANHLKYHEIKYTQLKNIEIGCKYIDFEYLDMNGEWQELNIFNLIREWK